MLASGVMPLRMSSIDVEAGSAQRQPAQMGKGQMRSYALADLSLPMKPAWPAFSYFAVDSLARLAVSSSVPKSPTWRVSFSSSPASVPL